MKNMASGVKDNKKDFFGGVYIRNTQKNPSKGVGLLLVRNGQIVNNDAEKQDVLNKFFIYS